MCVYNIKEYFSLENDRSRFKSSYCSCTDNHREDLSGTIFIKYCTNIIDKLSMSYLLLKDHDWHMYSCLRNLNEISHFIQ